MRMLLAATAALSLTPPASAQEEAEGSPSPNEIVESADASDWVAISADDLLVMTLAPGADGKERQVVMQLMPAPFSSRWLDNIRTLARSGWWDGLSINRVQENYVVQWGDPDSDDVVQAKSLPDQLRATRASDYEENLSNERLHRQDNGTFSSSGGERIRIDFGMDKIGGPDAYAQYTGFAYGFPVAWDQKRAWPVHCYGMVGVGRGYSPDAGSGAELYAVIGHAPRHLDRNIALIGRVIDGIEHMSTLKRGTGPLGFYERASERVPIRYIRLAGDLPEGEVAQFEYLSPRAKKFRDYADARANRRDPFFIKPAGGADICNIPVPVRRVVESASD